MNVTLPRSLWWSIGLVSIVALTAFLPSLELAADISYVYDDAGRLPDVIDPAIDTAIYAYDSVGNLTGITRQPSSTLVLLQLTPSASPIGTVLTIYGTGFSAIPCLQYREAQHRYSAGNHDRSGERHASLGGLS
jgi:YD repeat-containing protein